MSYDASTGRMHFEDALISMRNGGKVRRACWQGEGYLCISSASGIPRAVCKVTPFDGVSLWFNSPGDLISDDWEEVF